MEKIENRRLLIVDDNQAIHDDFKKILCPAARDTGAIKEAENALFGDLGQAPLMDAFEVDSAFQGQEGLQAVQRACQEGKPYALAFVDVRMPPGWDGIQTTSEIWKVDPEIQVVICTAYSDYSWSAMMAQLGRSDRLVVLKKPFDNIEALQLVHALTAKWELSRHARRRVEELDRLVAERTEQLRQSQKMEAVGRLAGGVAHDFNNILAVIIGNAELATDDAVALPNATNEALQQIIAAANKAANLTRQLLALGRKQLVQARPLQLNQHIANLSDMLKRIIGEDIQLQCAYAENLPLVQADASMIDQIIMNLLVNSRDAMPSGGRVELATELMEITASNPRAHAEARAGRFVIIRVADTGAGISREHLAHIFEPFFTTKDVGKGTGLGLATVFGIVKQHRGWVEVCSDVGVGTTFQIFLPALEKTEEAAPAPLPQRPQRRGEEVILLVEDDDAVRRINRRMLEEAGYRPLEAASGHEALGLWERNREKINLLLTDVVMPGGMNGRALAEQLSAAKPELKVLFMSGYSADILDDSTAFFERNRKGLLKKPFTRQELLHQIRSQLDELPAPAPLQTTTGSANGPAKGSILEN